MSSDATAALLNALQARDAEAWTQIIETYTDPLLGAAWGLGWKGTDAEDLVQDTYLTFLKKPDHFQGRSTLKTYLFGILYKKSLEKRRSHTREFASDPIDAVFESHFGFGGAWRVMPRGPEEETLSQETLEIVVQCAETLVADQRMAFYLREVEHESTETICNILEITPTHLGVLLFRARNRLRECVQKKWGENKAV